MSGCDYRQFFPPFFAITRVGTACFQRAWSNTDKLPGTPGKDALKKLFHEFSFYCHKIISYWKKKTENKTFNLTFIY